MIITKITGGLGNQLFQYAAGRALAEYHQTELKLDITDFSDYKIRNFDLDSFHPKYTFADKEEIKPFTNRSFFQKIRDRSAPFAQRRFNREAFFHYDTNFFKYTPPLYIKGYWQSEKYFINYKEFIKKELLFREKVIKNIKDKVISSGGKTPVSIHIRKGDYQNADALHMHGILKNTYYKNAIAYINQKVINPEFYIFSDSVSLLKQDAFFKDFLIVSDNISHNHFEDLYLMSQCKHNIIANSSFSWWGAWLNNNPDKIVIAPKNWFNKGPKDTQDLYPEGWIVL